MAAFEPPWLHSISPNSPLSAMDHPERKAGETTPTRASFSPTFSGRDRSKTLLVHQKSPLLISTPPQITRALAFSHPYLLPISHVLGLLSWTTGDPWESYLLLASFWALIVYGDAAIRYIGPVFMVGILLGAIYSRRYSPLSSKHSSEGTSRTEAESVKHRKSLDEIVEALNVFTSRCNMLAEPWLQLTAFLSTQLTSHGSSTSRVRGNVLLRILAIPAVWAVLTLHPFHILTTQRVVLVLGTIALTWHSRPARVCRSLLWRSLMIRRISAFLTGLPLANANVDLSPPKLPPRQISQTETALSVASKSKSSLGGVRFTFVVYENQRRWLGLGWTSAMLAYERPAWTDEHLNPAPPKEKFVLPEIEGGHAVWRWVPNDDWKTEETKGSSSREKGRSDGWIYYDNKVSPLCVARVLSLNEGKWNNGRKSDGWNQYTRRRKWYRDAELVEADGQMPVELSGDVSRKDTTARSNASHASSSGADRGDTSPAVTKKRPFAFRTNSKTSTKSSTSKTILSDDDTTDRPDATVDDAASSRFGLIEDIEMSLG